MKDNKLVSILIYIIVFVLAWNILDYLYTSFITRGSYQFSVSTDMIVPLTVMIIIYIAGTGFKKK